eukprot:m.476213 g.476213  ORF g.476213 m.476213 type:complete len:243 (+) comp40347_c0_seq1:107-835(+)
MSALVRDSVADQWQLSGMEVDAQGGASPQDGGRDHRRDSPIDTLSTELLWLVFSFLDPRTFLVTVRCVCRRFHHAVSTMPDASLDLRFLPRTAKLLRNQGEEEWQQATGVLAARFQVKSFTSHAGLNSEAIEAVLAACPRLKRLHVERNLDSDEVLAALATLPERCPDLTHLCLLESDLTPSAVQFVQGCSHLTSVTFAWAEEGAIEVLAQHCCQLVSLVCVEETNFVTNADMKALGTHCSR